MMLDDLRNKLSSLDAFLAADTDDINLAIDRLSGYSDPESIRHRISLLLKASRKGEAYSLVQTYSPHSKWIELGIRAAVLSGDFDLADSLVEVSDTLGDSSGTLRLRCIVALTDAIVSYHFSAVSSDNNKKSIYAVRPGNQIWFKKGLELLKPYCEAIFERQVIASPLEREVTTIFLAYLCLMGESEETNIYLPLLIKEGNIQPLLGQFMADGKLPLVPGFADVIIDSNSEDFYSLIFGELIRFLTLNDANLSFSNLTTLLNKATNDDEKALLFSALSEIAIQSGERYQTELDNITNSLLDLDNPQHCIRLAVQKIHYNLFEEAESLLLNNPLPDDPHWLKAISKCNFAKENINKGLDNIITASLSFKDELWLLEASELAVKHQRNSEAIKCLECLRDYYPWNINARKNLISLLINEDSYGEAITENENLIKLLPEDSELVVQLAFIYSRANKTEDGISLLNDLIISGNSTLHAILLLSSLLRQTNRLSEAFQLLDQKKENYWGAKEYLLAYLDIGYASGNDKKANDALVELNKLREKGEIDPKLFHLTSIDEVKSLIEDSHKQRTKIDEAILTGKLSWTISAELSNNTIYFDWRIRTQKLKWLPEDGANRTKYSVYSTNRFGSKLLGDHSELQEITLTTKPRNICLDYSALTTLFSLNKLSELFSRFENVYIPEQYRVNILAEKQRIQPHQLSHLNGYKAIRNHVDRNDITIIDDTEVSNYIVIDEYNVNENIDKNHLRSLKHLAETLADLGKLTTEQEKIFSNIVQRTDHDNSQIVSINDKIIINLHTLMTLFREGFLELITTTFKVSITKDDLDEIVKDLQGFEFQSETLSNYNNMWNQLFSFPNLKFRTVSRTPSTDDEIVKGISLLSLKLAQDKNLPLLADDRIFQTVLINSRGTPTDSAFGTDTLLNALLEDNIIEISDYSQSIIQLMKWRYRFILPKPEMLHYLATCYAGVKPGEELDFISQYIHDCMRDPGLFGGLENTEPPISMALKLYLTWTTLIGEFLALVWADQSINDQRSNAITEWVARIMLPSIPVAIHEQYQNRLSSSLIEVLLINALIRVSHENSHPRVPNSLRSLSNMLGISEHRYEQLISEVISRAAR